MFQLLIFGVNLIIPVSNNRMVCTWMIKLDKFLHLKQEEGSFVITSSVNNKATFKLQYLQNISALGQLRTQPSCKLNQK